jgi:ribulose-phosphate 3-epimerase
MEQKSEYPIICPAILAADKLSYAQQIAKVAQLAHRVQIDLTDGLFAQSQTIKPEEAWWPVGFKADFHLMYKQPLNAVQIVLQHTPNLIIVHAEAESDFRQVLDLCRRQSVSVGIALLADTSPERILPVINDIAHVLIFSGDLGKFGGQADLSLLAKIKFLKQHRPNLEIGWDGGVNDQNVAELVFGGVDVLNVGGFLQNAQNPADTYHTLVRIAEETGTT